MIKKAGLSAWKLQEKWHQTLYHKQQTQINIFSISFILYKQSNSFKFLNNIEFVANEVGTTKN